MSSRRPVPTRPAGRQARSTAALAARRIPGRPSGVTRRSLPQVDALLERDDVRAVCDRHGRPLAARLVRERLAELRRALADATLDAAGLDSAVAGIPAWIDTAAAALQRSTLRPVINATGVVLHTNLGRAPLPDSALQRMNEVARSFTTLEYDLARGRRGSRSVHLERIAALLFPGKALHVVNNNAAAMLLSLNTLAEGKEVVVSRGELVEIGGSFRIPDVMRKSGAVLREIGTTNRTRLADYERALGPSTALILKVHPSNYRIVGFTAQAGLDEVAALGRRRRIPVLFDQGSGNLMDLERHGVRHEPSVFDALEKGADAVCFSGDKLLGGPQAGLIVGRPDLVGRMRENPLTRALRVDKMTYAALEAVLWHYVRGTADTTLPVPRMIAASRAALEARARNIVSRVAERAGTTLDLSVVSGESVTGGGSAPEEGLPTALLTVAARMRSARELEAALRAGDPPVIGRIEGGRVLLDLRTVPDDRDAAVTEALCALGEPGSRPITR